MIAFDNFIFKSQSIFFPSQCHNFEIQNHYVVFVKIELKKNDAIRTKFNIKKLFIFCAQCQS